jgi:hypothetical protein
MLFNNLIVIVVLRWLCVPTTAVPTAAVCAASLPQSDLPRPPPGTTAKLVVRGVGTQNYTCTNSVPSSRGAVAALFDITYSQCPQQYSNGDATAKPLFPSVAGRHYFTQDLVPTFDIATAHMSFLFSATKAANVSSPDHSAVRSIDWLYLIPSAKAPNPGGVQAVYRVKTVGGVPTSPCTCDQEVPYTAEYWFFFASGYSTQTDIE